MAMGGRWLVSRHAMQAYVKRVRPRLVAMGAPRVTGSVRIKNGKVEPFHQALSEILRLCETAELSRDCYPARRYANDIDLASMKQLRLYTTYKPISCRMIVGTPADGRSDVLITVIEGTKYHRASDREWYTTTETSDVFGVDRSTIVDWCNKGLIHYRRLGRTRRISANAITLFAKFHPHRCNPNRATCPMPDGSKLAASKSRRYCRWSPWEVAIARDNSLSSTVVASMVSRSQMAVKLYRHRMAK